MSLVKPEISFVVLYVQDLERSRAFYEKMLGFPVKQTDPGYVEFSTGGAPLALLTTEAAEALTGKKPQQSAGAPRFALSLGEVPDVDKVYDELKKAGVEFLKAPETQPWGQRTTHLVDPDGNLWEVFTWVKKEPTA
jgi:lactoylglutathione lyase